jgi:hypothetical protein
MRLLVRFVVDGMYRPIRLATAADKGDNVQTFEARRSSWAVVSPSGVTHHGLWPNREDAELFARSLPRVAGSTWRVYAADYWYAAAFGRIVEPCASAHCRHYALECGRVCEEQAARERRADFNRSALEPGNR